MTVYADILFLVNFSMDVVTLYLTARLLHRSVKTARLCLSAAVGGGGATAATVLLAQSSFCENALLVAAGFVLSLVMCLIAFGGYAAFVSLLRDGVVLWGGGALLGGVMTFVLSLGEPVFANTGGATAFSAAFALCFGIAYVITRMFSSSRQKKTVAVTLDAGGAHAEFTAICDSGNLAREPISSLPVVIVSRTASEELWQMTAARNSVLKLRAIPIRTVAGDRVYMGFIADRITVDGRECAAAVAMDGESASYGGYYGIVPSSLSFERISRREKTDGGQTTCNNCDKSGVRGDRTGSDALFR